MKLSKIKDRLQSWYNQKSFSTKRYLSTLCGLVVAIGIYTVLAPEPIVATQQKISAPSFSKSYRDYSRSMAGDYLVGKFMQNKADFLTSSYYFERSLQLYPESGDLAEKSFFLNILSGNIDGAIADTEQYPHLKQELFTGRILYVLQDMYMGKYEQAEESLLQIAHSDVSNITDSDMMMVSLLVVWNKVAQDQLWEAHDLLMVLAEADKSHAAMWNYHLGLVADLGGFKTQASIAYDKALRNQDMMPYHIVDAAANFYSRHGEIEKAKNLYKEYQDRYQVQHYFNKELAILEKEQKVENKIITGAEQGVSHVVLDIIRISYSNDDLENALALSRIALHFNQKMPEALFMVAMISEDMGNIEQAITFFERIPNDSYLYQQARINMAENLHKKGYKDDAKDMLLYMSKGTPQNYELMTALANIMHQESDYQSAIAVYTQMIDNLEEVQSKHWPLLFNRAINYEQIGHWEKAEKDLVRAIELNPEQPDVLNFLAYHWLEQDKYIDTAIDMLEIAVAMRPEDPHVLDSMGWGLFKQERYIEASGYMEKALELSADDPILFDHLGDVYYHLGRKMEAVYQWSHALSFELDKQKRTAIRKKIDDGIQIKQAKQESHITGFNTP